MVKTMFMKNNTVGRIFFEHKVYVFGQGKSSGFMTLYFDVDNMRRTPLQANG